MPGGLRLFSLAPSPLARAGESAHLSTVFTAGRRCPAQAGLLASDPCPDPSVPNPSNGVPRRRIR
ncbi:hypothetical protein MPPM_4651 [Methylorubrum populi]|uniref:Uncharacterized protein n=1 Tax=Methylorubrum populi TaxID=223967 RepID=A0A160PJQ1_9HYPH|nr:hypothetical protein MPPM_4651 [Methylorubrum populi]